MKTKNMAKWTTVLAAGLLTVGLTGVSEPANAQQVSPKAKKTSRVKLKKKRITPKKTAKSAQKKKIEDAIEEVDAGASGGWSISVDAQCRLQQTLSATSSNNTIKLTQVRMIQFNTGHLSLVCQSGKCASYSHELGSSSSNKLEVHYQEASKGDVLRALQTAVSECREYHGLAPLETGEKA